MSYATFETPKEMIVFGWGALEYVRHLTGMRAFIVTDSNLATCTDYVRRVTELLQEDGRRAVQTFTEVEADPSTDTVYKGTEVMRSWEPDLVVGLGGGSPIDAGKMMWALYEHPELDLKKVRLGEAAPGTPRKAKYVAIPTTSGTGSEATPYAVITDRSSKPHVKFTCSNLYPDVAILDPELTSSMPARVAASTGMDVLVHAIEAFVSRVDTRFVDPIALEAIRLTFEYLPASVRGDRRAREAMHFAACMGGMAIATGRCGLVHAMAHQIGAQYGVPHGAANGILLPYVIEYDVEVAAAKYAEISRVIGINFQDTSKAVSGLLDAIRRLQSDICMPVTLAEAGIDRDLFLRELEQISLNALNDGTTQWDPGSPSVDDIATIYRCALDGQSRKR